MPHLWAGLFFALTTTLTTSVRSQSQGLTNALNDLQPACKSSLVPATSSISGCTNLVGLLTLSNTPSSQSVVGPLNNYTASLNTEPWCSKNDLSGKNHRLLTIGAAAHKSSIAVREAISTNCKQDINKTAIKTLQAVATNYDAIRNLLVLSETTASKSNGNFCMIQILSDAQTASHTLFTQSELFSLIGGTPKPFLNLVNKVDKSKYCTGMGSSSSKACGH
ncbi:MAG: hypothetical protein CYPHOPRED_000948 [Cyphobasidiales sp. Tagirdzhanova-0007]|nr:MAG: hypothetical protein CYPHOPRED_000948 [Cyphobasidiales sp. Tagirdzhanova-0007]